MTEPTTAEQFAEAVEALFDALDAAQRYDLDDDPDQPASTADLMAEIQADTNKEIR